MTAVDELMKFQMQPQLLSLSLFCFVLFWYVVFYGVVWRVRPCIMFKYNVKYNHVQNECIGNPKTGEKMEEWCREDEKEKVEKAIVTLSFPR